MKYSSKKAGLAEKLKAGLKLATCALALGFGLQLARPALAEEISVTWWGSLMYGGPYAVALEKGYFKQAGVDVTGILTSKGGGTTVRNVLAGGLPYGEVSLSAAIAAAKEGLAIKIVNSGTVSVADIIMVTMPDSPIKTVKDLAGKKVAFTSPKSVTEMVITMVLNKHGLKPGQVEMISTGGIGAGLTALAQGGVVAAPILDPIWSRDSQKYKPLFKTGDELPRMTQTVGIVTEEFAKAQPAKVRAIIEGRRRGVDFINANPKEAGEIFAKHYNLDPALGIKAVQNMIDFKYWGRGDLDLAAMENMTEGLRIVGDLTGPVDWSKLVDDSFLPADLRKKS